MLWSTWERYRRGEQNVFDRRLYTPQGGAAFDEIRRRYRGEREFRDTVDRYIQEFERLLSEVARDDRDGSLAKSYLVSDTGKVLRCWRTQRSVSNNRSLLQGGQGRRVGALFARSATTGKRRPERENRTSNGRQGRPGDGAARGIGWRRRAAFWRMAGRWRRSTTMSRRSLPRFQELKARERALELPLDVRYPEHAERAVGAVREKFDGSMRW